MCSAPCSRVHGTAGVGGEWGSVGGRCTCKRRCDRLGLARLCVRVRVRGGVDTSRLEEHRRGDGASGEPSAEVMTSAK